MSGFGIGSPVPREEDRRLLTGRGLFLDDLSLPGQAHGVVLRSPHAHAAIGRIDTARAARAPGVLAVLTGRDVRADGLGSLRCEEDRTRPDGSPMPRPPQPALVTDRVRFVGDPVAFVVAETEARAHDAMSLIAVDYTPLPAVISIAEALAPGAPAVWADCPDNICFAHAEGDAQAVAAAMAGAPHVVERDLAVNRITAVAMEPRGCIGEYDRRADRYTLHTGLQNPHQVRNELAVNVFGVAETRIRVVSGDIGGSFGMRGANYRELVLVLWAARRIGRPVKWVASRTEGFATDDHARDNFSTLALAFDEDGRFLALKIATCANLGAYLSVRGPRPPIGNLGTLAGIYRTPAVQAEVTGVFTNTTATSPYRGSGAPEAAYVTEHMVDIAARTCGLDRAEIRRRNAVTSEMMPWTNALGHVYDVGDFPANLERALHGAAYDGFADRRARSAARGRLRGIGLAATVKKTSTPNIEGAEIRFDPSGTIALIMGTLSHGQGHETVFKQILCQRLGVAPDAVRFVQGDTDVAVYGKGTFNSRSLSIGGAAIAVAADKVIDKGRRIAAYLLEAATADIAFDDGAFAVRGTDRRVGLDAVVAAAFAPQRLPPDIEPGFSAQGFFAPRYWNWPSSAQVCEVEIDPETGAVAIKRFVCVSDAGTVVNPMLYYGQLHGGIAQGIGQALLEDIRFAPGSGQLLTGSLMDYALPRARDLSSIAVTSMPRPTASNPLGTKGVGESGPTGALPATMGAILDALAPLGIEEIAMPATPERIWQAIRRAGPGQAEQGAAEAVTTGRRDGAPVPARQTVLAGASRPIR